MAVKNICRCIQPPGGTGTCEPHQLAICRSNGIDCSPECRDPPPGTRSLQDLEAWAYAMITGRRPLLPLRSADRDMLSKGTYVNPVSGEVTNFVMPQWKPGPSSGSGPFGSSGGGLGGGGSGSDATRQKIPQPV